MAVEVIYGAAEVDLFDGPGPNHRTYRADGHWLTGVESFDSAVFCTQSEAIASMEGDGYTAEDAGWPGTWWIKNSDDTYGDATIYGDVDFRDEMAPYVCHFCGVTLYEDDEDDG